MELSEELKRPTPGIDVDMEGGQQQQQQAWPAVGVKRSRRDLRASTAKDRISKMPPCAAGKRSSIYRGVTRHRWTGRYEAHLWDKSTWNQAQNKKGKQVYLGAYDEEEAAARAYDLAALKYWGPGTLINFPVSDYSRDIEEMQNVTREEYLASLRRKSSGFSRGMSKYRGVAGRHHHHNHGRWEAGIGRVFGNKYLYLGTYSNQYRGLNTVTDFDLSRYIRWLRPEQGNSTIIQETDSTVSPNGGAGDSHLTGPSTEDQHARKQHSHSAEPYQHPSLGPSSQQQMSSSSSPSVLSLLLHSSMFKQMMARASAIDEQYENNSSEAYYSSRGNLTSILGDDEVLSAHQDLQDHNQQQQQQQHYRELQTAAVFGHCDTQRPPCSSYPASNLDRGSLLEDRTWVLPNSLPTSDPAISTS